MDTTHAKSAVDKKLRRAQLEKGRYACSHCPPHDGDNRGRRPRADRYKSLRKGLRKGRREGRREGRR